MAADKSSDKRDTARDPKRTKSRDELDAGALDKVTGGVAASKIVKSADPCEGGR